MILKKRHLYFLAGIGISALFLILTLRNIKWNRVLLLLRETQYIVILPALIMFFADFTLRTFRWKYLVMPLKKCKFSNLLSSVFIGFFGNSIFPMRAGEFIRSYTIGTKEKISKSSSLATIAVERVMDGFALLFLLLISFLFMPFPDRLENIFQLVVFLFFVLVVLFYGLIFYRKTTMKVVRKILKIFPEKIASKLAKLINSFITGLEIMKKPRYMFMAFLFSLMSWTANASVFYFVGQAMGIEITLAGGIFTTTVISLGISIPSSPGHIGVFEYFGVLAATLIGIERSEAFGFIILVHFIQLVLLISVGIFFSMKEHISITKLEKKAGK